MSACKLHLQFSLTLRKFFTLCNHIKDFYKLKKEQFLELLKVNKGKMHEQRLKEFEFEDHEVVEF